VPVLDAAELVNQLAGVAPWVMASEIMRPKASENAAAVPPGLPRITKHSLGPNSSSFIVT
jgi:hypothetical protein